MSQPKFEGIRRFQMSVQADEAEIFLYDVIGEGGFFGGATSAKEFADEFNALPKNLSRYVLHLNSPGGDVWQASAIYTLITQSAIPVDVMIDGAAASAAFTVAMGGRKVSIGEAGMMMLHNARAMVMGEAEDMRHTADVVDQISEQMAAIYAKRCRRPVAEVKKMMDAETWLTPQEAVDMGFADEVVASDREDIAAKMVASFDLSRFKNVPEAFKMRVAAIAVTAEAKTKRVDGEDLTISAFAYRGDPEKTEEWKLPIEFSTAEKSASHVRNAIARFNQTDMPDAAEKGRAWSRIKAAAKKHGIDVSEDSAPSGAENKTVATDKRRSATQMENSNNGNNSTVATVEVKEDAQKIERERCAAINALARDNNLDLQPYIEQGTPLSDVKMVVADKVLARAKAESKDGGLAHPTVLALSERERSNYSVARLIMSMADAQLGGAHSNDAGLEREISASIAKDLKMSPRGMFVPTRLRPQMTGLDTLVGGTAKYTVATEVRDLIELLRAKTKVINPLGATVLPGLTSNVQFPRHTTAAYGAWTTENPGSDITDHDAVFGYVTLSPKTYAASTSYSRQLLQQSTIDVENFVRTDLAEAHGQALDKVAICGGGSNEPTGVLKTGSIGDVTMGTSGGAPTYAKIVDMETNVATSNADEAGMKWLTTPTMRGKLKQTAVIATYGTLFVWNQLGNAPGAGDMLGYPAYVSTNVPSTLVTDASDHSDCHAIILGYWPSLLIGEFGVLDLVVDPYRLKKQGMIEVTSFQMVDVALRQPAQFCAMQDARNV